MTLPTLPLDLVGSLLGFFFTVAILSYVIGDNPLYRLALHLFVGVAAGYAGLVVITNVLTPRLITPMSSGNPTLSILAAVPLLLFVFLILKLSPRTSAFGNIGVAFMVGVGTAVAIGGAVTGTLFPQVMATWRINAPSPSPIVNQIIIVLGAVTTLLYFQYWLRAETTAGAERAAVMQVLADIGKGFVVASLGAIYAGMILSGIAVLSDRVIAMATWIQQFMP